MNITKIYNLEPKESARLKELNVTITTSFKNIIEPQYRERFYYNADKHVKFAVELLMLPFNQSYLENTTMTFEELDVFINYLVYQSDFTKHPLTCGRNSEHQLLMPRMDHNKEKYLICPTCGYIQPLK